MQILPEFRPEDFPNKLGLLPLSSSDIESQVSGYSLSFPQTRNAVVERGLKFPQFVRAFYNFIYKYGKVPTQAEFFEFYLKINAAYFQNAGLSSVIIDGLKARVFRTYPSLVRDFHFNKKLSELLPDYEIVYNSDLDIEHDIDTLLIRDGHYWAACLYTQTKRANIAREWKEYRHEHFSNVEYIEFPVKLDDNNKLGDFFLYGENELKTLLKYIHEKQ